MNLERYLNNKIELPKLKRFAALSGESFHRKLEYLIQIAEPEDWSQVDHHTKKCNSTLFYYIIHTFDRVFEQGKIVIDEKEQDAFFNTGLMTLQGCEIYGHFEKSMYYDANNPESNYWYFKCFERSNDKEFISKCEIKPPIATYFEDFRQLYFDPTLDIEINFDHIYHDNYERLPNEMQILDKEIARHVFEGFLDFTKKKILRNHRIPVPQFYNSKIMFLIPVRVFGNQTIIIALEKINGKYMANTVLSKGMAYNCARLINKPESDWLLSKND
ncbi:MAG: DUF3825 domain-containing protein [Bacilli bacterium]|nr:DUF3825 domain-containing protein [Bacilli bacterium]